MEVISLDEDDSPNNITTRYKYEDSEVTVFKCRILGVETKPYGQHVMVGPLQRVNWGDLAVPPPLMKRVHDWPQRQPAPFTRRFLPTTWNLPAIKLKKPNTKPKQNTKPKPNTKQEKMSDGQVHLSDWQTFTHLQILS